MDTFRVAVIAGTPVDTRMGVEYLESRKDAMPEPLYMPVAEDCDAQIRFQYSDMRSKTSRIDELFDPAIAAGIEDFFIYCNSLSGAVDFDVYAEHKREETGRPVRVYTPLQVYRTLGSRYSRVGVMAANNLSAYNIERALMASNEDIYMIGTGNMAVVSAIESGTPPHDIVTELGLADMLRYMEACGAQALILGCTHFPYIREELERYSHIPVIDPADEMFRTMMSCISGS